MRTLMLSFALGSHGGRHVPVAGVCAPARLSGRLSTDSVSLLPVSSQPGQWLGRSAVLMAQHQLLSVSRRLRAARALLYLSSAYYFE